MLNRSCGRPSHRRQMPTIATVMAVGVDSKVTIPNLSLVFVVPVIIASVSLGLGPPLCSAILAL
jgi:hypothetical protein